MGRHLAVLAATSLGQEFTNSRAHRHGPQSERRGQADACFGGLLEFFALRIGSVHSE
jgi:hypothetical protein